MSDIAFKERIRFPMPVTELNRRHTAVKAAMEKEGLDMLIMSNDNQYLGGYVRYFTDIPAGNAYPITILFEKSGEITSISVGAPSKPGPPDWAARVIHNCVSAPYFRSLNYTHFLDADEAIKVIKAKNVKRLGLVGVGMLSYEMMRLIKEKTNVEFINATPLVDKIKNVKSAEELKFIQLGVQMHDESVDFLKSIIKPGMYEYEVHAELARWLKVYGSEEQLLIMMSQTGSVPHIIPRFFQNRKVNKGDYFTILNESSGPGGYYCEIARTFCLGEPSKAAYEAVETAIQLQHWVASLMKPGVAANTILKTYNERLKEMGIPIEERLFTHGQGYDLVEMPGFAAEDYTILEENMFISIHPAIDIPGGTHAYMCDDFLITSQGTVRQMKQPQQLVIIE